MIVEDQTKRRRLALVLEDIDGQQIYLANVELAPGLDFPPEFPTDVRVTLHIFGMFDLFTLGRNKLFAAALDAWRALDRGQGTGRPEFRKAGTPSAEPE